jgi:hypothetical protein
MPADPLSDFIEQQNTRIEEILRRFGSYQPQGVDRERIRIWLRQFQSEDFDLILRVLENVEFYDLARLHELLRALHKAIRTQAHSDGFRNLENLVFVPIGETAESGQEIIRRYRNVNRTINAKAKLAQVIELPKLLYEADKTGEKLALVFLDDFIGTGKKVSDYWKQVLSHHIYPNRTMYVGTAVACNIGLRRVEDETPLHVIPVHIVRDRHLINETNQFTPAEKYRIRSYCDEVGNPPLGIGSLGVMVAFAHGCPNNTLSILRGSKLQRHRRGILPRFEDIP